MAKREIYCQQCDGEIHRMINNGTSSGAKCTAYISNLLVRRWAIPSWEKEFCLEAGLFEWENFLKAKQNTRNDYKVLHWNDSAAEEAFHAAKKRYFARINGLPYTEGGPLMDPDLFIDENKWDDGDDIYTEYLREKMIIAKLEKEEEEEDFRYYSRMIEEVRLGQTSEV